MMPAQGVPVTAAAGVGPIECGPARWLTEEEWEASEQVRRRGDRLARALIRAMSAPWRCLHGLGSLTTCDACGRTVTGERTRPIVALMPGAFRFVHVEMR